MVTIELPDGAPSIIVSDWTEIIDWLRIEASNWDWLNGENSSDNGVGRQVISQWQTIIQISTGLQNRGESIDTVKNILTDLTSGALLHRESDKGSLVLDIRNSVGKEEAAWAYGFLTNRHSLEQIRTPAALRGVMLVAFPNMQSAADLELRLRRERSRYRSELNSAIAKVGKLHENSEIEWLKAIERAKSVGFQALRRNRKRWIDSRRVWQQSADDAVSSISNTEKTFKEFMQLRAPVDYWTGKSAEHTASRSTAFNNLRIYFLALVAVLGTAFGLAGWGVASIHDAKNEPVALYVLISAGLAVLSTIGFWIGRILTKLYLSEHHLKTDADERATMIKTYLALTENGAATEADKQIVLSALFRPTSDGIVRDEGPPDVALQSIAARMLAGNGKI